MISEDGELREMREPPKRRYLLINYNGGALKIVRTRL
jgi:hypothetical protein